MTSLLRNGAGPIRVPICSPNSYTICQAHINGPKIDYRPGINLLDLRGFQVSSGKAAEVIALKV
jgi:hypothetical protein